MITNNITTPNYTPNFCALKNFKLPTKEVLECTTGKLSNETIEKPEGLFSIFSKLFCLKKTDIKDFAKTPLALDLYTISSGVMIKTNNPAIAHISNRIKSLPTEQMTQEINQIIKKMGNTLNIQIDDEITGYKVANGKISIIKETTINP